jgi:hypothetical protein
LSSAAFVESPGATTPSATWITEAGSSWCWCWCWCWWPPPLAGGSLPTHSSIPAPTSKLLAGSGAGHPLFGETLAVRPSSPAPSGTLLGSATASPVHALVRELMR